MPRSKLHCFLLAISALYWTQSSAQNLYATEVVLWDFRTQTQGRSKLQGWKANHYVSDSYQNAEGWSLQSMGVDPWIEGPTVHVPADRITRVVVRMKSNADSAGELFYGTQFRAGHSVRFVVLNDERWHDYELIITESLGRGTRFRLDPATQAGDITVQSILVESLPKPPIPPFKKPSAAQSQRNPGHRVTSGPLQIKHYGTRMGNFQVLIDDAPVAVGYQSELLGLWADDAPEWLDLGQADVTVEFPDDSHLTIRTSVSDSQGGSWQIERVFRAGEIPGTVQVHSRIQVDRDRDIILLPWFTLYAGLESFGSQKTQALLAGLEYLSNEPSSNQADITTPESLRRIPDPLKVTFPLMALSQGNRYLGLLWEPSPWTNPLFDSPDRLTDTDAHVLGVTGPAVGPHRFENDLTAYRPVTLRANESLETNVTLIGGVGQSVIPAVQHYVTLQPLPDVPEVNGGFPAAVTLLSHGWLDSQIREGGLFRHAVWHDLFNTQRAADAAMYMDWLATSLPAHDPLAIQLEQTRDLALAEIPGHQTFTSTVSHVRPPTTSLLFGRLEPFVSNAYQSAKHMIQSYTPEGLLIYQPGDTDFGSTHFADHANGYGGRNLVRILENTTLCMEPDLVQDALALLDKQTVLYGKTVPRGAQTWEIPLHTPDIMASAHMCRSYVLGYLLSGRDDYLDQARYWAWTGVAFIYLADPTPFPVGRYATIPVLGATHWVGSWFGRPVQWCGLVYASALHLLYDVDPEGPWRQLALGITASGLQQCWNTEDTARQGLLPDYFYLRSQVPDGPAINPGTVQAHLPELFDQGRLYDVRKVPFGNWIIHAPCAIDDIETEGNYTQFSLAGWGSLDRTGDYHVLISGLSKKPLQVQQRRSDSELSDWQNLAPALMTYYNSPFGHLVLRLQGPVDIRIGTGR